MGEWCSNVGLVQRAQVAHKRWELRGLLALVGARHFVGVPITNPTEGAVEAYILCDVALLYWAGCEVDSLSRRQSAQHNNE